MKKVTFFKPSLFFLLLFSCFILNASIAVTGGHRVVKGNWLNPMTSEEIPFNDLSFISIWLDENQGLDINLTATTSDNAMHLYDDLYIYYEIGAYSGVFGPIAETDLIWDTIEEVYTVTKNVQLTFQSECNDSKNGIFRADVAFGIATKDPDDGSLIDYPFDDNLSLFDESDFDDYSNFVDRSKRFVCSGGAQLMTVNNPNPATQETILTKEPTKSKESTRAQQDFYSNLSLSPNPFNNEFTVKYQINNTSNVKFILTDLLGNQLSQKIFDKQSKGIYSEQFVLDNGIAKGIYFLHIFYENKIETIKLLKSE